MNNKDKPIGVFDSGLGGLSVLKHMRSLMPNENFIYYGDSANAPYGTKSHDEIFNLSCDCAKKLCDMGIKALVVACNTATSIAINHLREVYKNIPVIGLEPALKPAVENSKGGKIIVMATPATLSEEKFAALYKKWKGEWDISLLPSPGLVEAVENSKFDTPELYSLLEKLFAPFEKDTVESVVLGCTHYPFVAREIKKVLGSHVTLYDGGLGAAAECRRRLEASNLLKTEGSGETTIFNSLNKEEAYKKSLALLDLSI